MTPNHMQWRNTWFDDKFHAHVELTYCYGHFELAMMLRQNFGKNPQPLYPMEQVR